MLFVHSKPFRKKKITINWLEIVLIPSFTILIAQKLTSYFCWLWTSYKLLSEKLCDLRDFWPCHWSLCFLVSPCYLQDAMPCQWSSSDLLQVLRIWEGVFYSQAFLPCTSSCYFMASLGRQFNLKVSMGFMLIFET